MLEQLSLRHQMSLQRFSYATHRDCFRFFYNYFCPFIENRIKRCYYYLRKNKDLKPRLVKGILQRHLLFLKCLVAYHYHNDHCRLWRLLSQNHFWETNRCNSGGLGYIYSVSDGRCPHKHTQHGSKLEKSTYSS
jgi:hypothetical protein